MKIDHLNGSGLPNRPDRVGGSEESGRQPDTAVPVDGGDRIQLSEAAKVRSALADAAAKLPEVREERVNAVKQDLAQGTYRVDPKLVARALLEFEDGLER